MSRGDGEHGDIWGEEEESAIGGDLGVYLMTNIWPYRGNILDLNTPTPPLIGSRLQLY
jgi:hypothetical protein